MSVLERIDRALLDPPSLCCDDDHLCPACGAESMPALTANG
jgi:hypothetical protein